MHISLAIATIHRQQELERLLDSLCQQNYKDFEVLIADQNPDNFLEPIVKNYRGRLQISRIACKPCGVSSARNVLFPHIKGQIVAFPDDDCWYSPETLEMVVRFFTNTPSAGALLGLWVDKPVHKYEKSQEIKSLQRIHFFRGSATYVQFYRRTIIDVVGYFDPILGPGTNLPYGCGEDTDYILRAAKIASIWHVPTVRIYHPLPLINKPQKEKIFAYGAGRMYLLRKHKFPLWFHWANIIFPLYRIIIEGPRAFKYRWYMFLSRLKGFFVE